MILDESVELLRADRGRLICRTRHGFVCANAGVDQSNTGAADVVLLPERPDASAAALRAALGVGAVVITDSWGRPWRQGQVEVAIGCAGLAPLVDLRVGGGPRRAGAGGDGDRRGRRGGGGGGSGAREGVGRARGARPRPRRTAH